MARETTKAAAAEEPHPVHKASTGALQLAVWENEHEVDADKRVFHSVTLERNYKDKNEALVSPELRHKPPPRTH